MNSEFRLEEGDEEEEDVKPDLSVLMETCVDPNTPSEEFKLKNMFAIDAPAKVENINNFLKCCGGLRSIQATFNNPRERLKFKFRPDDPNSIPLFSERKTTADVAVKVRRKRRPDGTYHDYQFEPCGIVDTTFHFDNAICDMQLLPTSDDIRNELMKSDFILTCDPSFSLENDHSVTMLKHFFYSRFTSPKTNFWQMAKEENPLKSSNDILQIRRSRKVVGLFIRWEDEVPIEVPELVKQKLDAKMFDEELAVQIRRQFADRPIWSKAALLSRIECTNEVHLKFTLPLFAFFYENGPFRYLWVRYGYDPKMDPSSKIYQTIEIRNRVPIGNSNDYLYKIALFKDNSIAYETLFDFPINESPGGETNGQREERHLFQPGKLWVFRRNRYQLCDVEVDAVQSIIHENDGTERECTEKDGWCSPGAIERMRQAMHHVISEMLEDPQINKQLTEQQQQQRKTRPESDAQVELEDETCDAIEVSEIYEHFDFLDQDGEQGEHLTLNDVIDQTGSST